MAPTFDPNNVTHDPLEAARAMARRFGIERLARLLGRHPQVLRNQLNPEQEGHQLALATAVAMTDVLDDNAILVAWAASRGFVMVKVPTGSATEEELLDDVLELEEHHGDFAKTLRTARADGVIDESEVKALVSLLRRVIAQAATLERGVTSQVREVPAIGGRRA